MFLHHLHLHIIQIEPPFIDFLLILAFNRLFILRLTLLLDPLKWTRLLAQFRLNIIYLIIILFVLQLFNLFILVNIRNKLSILLFLILFLVEILLLYLFLSICQIINSRRIRFYFFLQFLVSLLLTTQVLTLLPSRIVQFLNVLAIFALLFVRINTWQLIFYFLDLNQIGRTIQ